MKKLTMLAAVSAMAIGTAAQAGQLELKLKNINGNGNDAIDDYMDVPTGQITIDRPNYILGQIVVPSVDPHAPPLMVPAKVKATGAVLASERVVSEDHPFEAHFEVNATRFDDDGELTEFLPEEFLLEISVNNAVWKQNLNGEDLIRNGMMGEGDLDADVLGGTGAEGTSFAQVSVINQGNRKQTDFGLLLPLRATGGDNDILTPCEPIQVQVQAFSTVGFGGPQALGPADIITIMQCDESFGFRAESGLAKVDFQSDFKLFLDEDHKGPYDRITVGSFYLDVWNHLFDPKTTDEEQRIVDVSDIDRHEITLQFIDLQGIEEVNLITEAGPVAGTLNRAAATASFVIPGAAFEAIAEDSTEVAEGDEDIDHDGTPETTLVEQTAHATIELVAFGPDADKFIKEPIFNDKGEQIGENKVPTGAGAIDHQNIFISENTLFLDEPCKERDGITINGSVGGDTKAPKFICSIPLPVGLDIGELQLTGQNFGPFDWVFQSNAAPDNFFRISHYPLVDGHGEPVTSLKGIMTLKNSTGTNGSDGALYDGTYKFDIPFDFAVPARGRNGVFQLGPQDVANIIAADPGNAPNTAFGTSDISFTFFVNSAPGAGSAPVTSFSENFKIDVDRLIMTNGVMVPYGDNSNDSNSDHAVSGDQGRFGPKVPLKFRKDVKMESAR